MDGWEQGGGGADLLEVGETLRAHAHTHTPSRLGPRHRNPSMVDHRMRQQRREK